MDGPRRSNRLPHPIQTEALTRYLLLACGGALLLGSFFVIWQIIASFGTGNPALGLALTLVLLGSAYLMVSLALQSIVLAQDRIVVAQWLFLPPRVIAFSTLDRLDQVTVGPADLLWIHWKGASHPLRLLNLFSREDISFAQDTIDRRASPPAADPEILRRAGGLRGRGRPPAAGPEDPTNLHRPGGQPPSG